MMRTDIVEPLQPIQELEQFFEELDIELFRSYVVNGVGGISTFYVSLYDESKIVFNVFDAKLGSVDDMFVTVGIYNGRNYYVYWPKNEVSGLHSIWPEDLTIIQASDKLSYNEFVNFLKCFKEHLR